MHKIFPQECMRSISCPSRQSANCLLLGNFLQTLGTEVLLEPALDGLHELGRGDPGLALLLATSERKILGHDLVVVHRVDDGLLERFGPCDQLGRVVELAALDQAAGPREDAGDGVRRGLATLLMLAVVSCNRAVGGFGLVSQPVGGDQLRSHQAERAETLGHNVGLDVAVVVLHGDDKAAGRLDHLGHHVIDETMLVPDLLGLELLDVFLVVDLLEDVLESPVVGFEDGVLSAHVQRISAIKGKLEARMREASNAVVGVVLRLRDTARLGEVEDLDLLGLSSIFGCEDHLQCARRANDFVFGAVLVTEGVATDDDGLLPARNQARDAGNDNGFAEDGATKNVSNGAVGRKPH